MSPKEITGSINKYVFTCTFTTFWKIAKNWKILDTEVKEALGSYIYSLSSTK